MFAKKKLLLLFLLFFFNAGICQDGALQFFANGFYIKQYSEIAGLVSNSCKNMYQDSRGFLWITTFKGLSRFDGKQFVNYSVKNGLPGSDITQVSEDTSGFIYVATTTGIARYTGCTKSANFCFYIYPQTQHLNSAIVGMQAIDSNTIIFQQANGAVFALKNNKLLQLSPPAPENANVIIKDKYNHYYSYTEDTMRVFNNSLVTVKKIYQPDGDCTCESLDNTGQLHLLYPGGEKRRLNHAMADFTSKVPDSIRTFSLIDTLDKMFYLKENILYFYDKNVSREIFDFRDLFLRLNSMMLSREGNLWIATGNAGLFRITPLTYSDKEIKISEYHFRNVNNRKIIESNSRLITKPGVIDTYRKLEKEIRSVFLSKADTAWFCTNTGFYKQAPGKQPVHYIFPGSKFRWGDEASRIEEAIETPNGDMWFYGNCGAIRYSNGRFRHFNHLNGLSQQDKIRHIIADKNGAVLLLDYYNILFEVQGDTLMPIGKQLGFSNFVPEMIKSDHKGNIWIGYNQKLFRIEKQQTGKYSITDSIVPSSLSPLPEISAFAFDGQGNCWVGYAGGRMQVYFITEKGSYTYANSITYTTDDGFAPISATNYSLWPDDDGNIVLMPFKQGDRRIFLFRPQDALLRKELNKPQVSFTKIIINHKVPDWISMGYSTGPEGLPASPSLSYSNNNITFNYMGVSLSNPTGIVYQTKLEGYDKEWQTATETSVNYTNLPPGSYTLMVKAANINGSWSDIMLYPLFISPPWYKAWWAVLLWILLGSSIILFLVFLRINSIRMSNLKENNLFKSNLIGLIGHDMMTPLRYIAKVSMQLKTYNNKLSKETTLDSLGDITVTASRLQFFGESILHWINLQNSEFSPAMERFHVNKAIDELVEFHQRLAVEKGNSISYEVYNDLFCYQDPILVKIILHNLLLNANKFTTNGKIKILARLEQNWFTMIVKDTGKGMNQDKVDSLNRFQPILSSPGTFKEKGWGMGYKMIMDLLKFSKGSLHVKSKINHGTEVTISLFCNKNEYHQRLKEMYNN